MSAPKFRTLLIEALRWFATNGYTSEAELQAWMSRLHAALERELPSDEYDRKTLADALESIFARDVDRGAVRKLVPGVSRYDLSRVAPQLRAELDRRIFAGVSLIRLNKRAATEKTLQRFAGWVTSTAASTQPGQRVRARGAVAPDIRAAAREISKPSKQLKWERRRVAIDQGHKLSAAVAHVVAEGNGAIAAIWYDRGANDRGYDARPEHLARTGKLFLIRDSWALREGLIAKRGSVQYTDEIEQPAERPFCSCSYQYITSPRALPPDLLTAKGRAWLEVGARSFAAV